MSYPRKLSPRVAEYSAPVAFATVESVFSPAMSTPFPELTPVELPPLVTLLELAEVTEDDAQVLLDGWKADTPLEGYEDFLEAEYVEDFEGDR